MAGMTLKCEFDKPKRHSSSRHSQFDGSINHFIDPSICQKSYCLAYSYCTGDFSQKTSPLYIPEREREIVFLFASRAIIPRKYHSIVHMSSPYQTIRSSRVGVVAVAMAAIVLLQRTTSAFMGGTIAASPRSFLSRQFTTSHNHAAVVVGSRVFGGGNTLLLQVRGGAASASSNPRGGFPLQATVAASSSSSSSAASSSSSSTSAALSSSGGDKGGVDLDKEAQATLGIVGKSIQASTFAGEIPYLNTQDCNEFRVLFVLGGPGAGKSFL